MQSNRLTRSASRDRLKDRMNSFRSASFGIAVVLLGGIGHNASQSWESSLSYIEAEEAAWRYIEEQEMLGMVVPVLPSRSMEPELHGNQLAVVELIPFSEVEVGQIAVFREPGSSNPTAHLVENILPDGRLQTRGLTNTRFDPLVTEDRFIGVIRETFDYRGTKRWIQPDFS